MQTKKRAKPVKFGKAAREAEEKKVEVEAPRESAAEHVVSEAPTQPEAPSAPAGGGELVDKLSDVPFEADFGDAPEPSQPPTQPHVPQIPQALEPVQPAASSVEPHVPETTVQSDNLQAAPSAFDTPPAGSSSIPPIGRASEPIPFSPHDTVFNTPPESGEKKKNPFLYFLIIALVAFVTGIAFMAGIYYAMPDKNFLAMLTIPSVQEPTPTTAPVVVATPTVAPSKEVKLADYKVKVLNGSGVSGQAAKVKASLTAEGFTVTSTGNAETSDVVKTQITYKKSVSADALTKVKTILKKTYVLDKETALPDSATKESDITITIGKETAK